MANDNVELGRFDLVGIPPAPRGVPKIEVTFNIDVNGIVHVSAKDMGTGKEQSIRITAPQKLKEEDIDKMVKDAELYAQEDNKRKELAESRNKADTLIYATEKSLKDYGDKISDKDKKSIEEKLNTLKEVIKKEGMTKEELEKGIDELTKASHKLAEEMYKASAQEQAKAGPQPGQEAGPKPEEKEAGGKTEKEEDIIEAEYKEEDDDKKK